MGRKIIEYKVIEKCDLKELVERVNDLIKNGWEPFGGIASEGVEGDFCQAMVKYSE
ncbi:MAG TPA: DUF1737 domain-containing protein [Ignavibacteria bacterium]